MQRLIVCIQTDLISPHPTCDRISPLSAVKKCDRTSPHLSSQSVISLSPQQDKGDRIPSSSENAIALLIIYSG
jgi:hypothetical protein